MKTQIEKLNAELVKAQTAYYAGNPIMSDADFDAKEAQLAGLISANPQFSNLATVLTKVGAEQTSGKRISHVRPMKSIENYFTEETFGAATANYGTDMLLEPKRDGISCELRYKNGVLTLALTRGDGDAGEDMTVQVRACNRIPSQFARLLPVKNLHLRGELVMRNRELARINKVLEAAGEKPYANTRNLVAGTMKQKDTSIVASREIVFKPWDLYSPDQDEKLPDSGFERMQLAFSLGFPEYGGYKVSVTNSNDFWNTFHILLEMNKVSDINADGIVVKADSHKLRNKLGVSSKYTNYQHCFKPQNLAAETVLLGIEYGLGRTGKITPVALLQPVNLGGAMVARASVCNETYMEALGLKIGATVKVLRSGDVIPQITEVVNSKGGKAIVFPTRCPSCNSVLVEGDSDSEIVQKFCQNSSCPGKAAEHFAYIANRETLEIDNLGDSMAAELVALHKATNIAELFEFGDNVLFARNGDTDAQFTKRIKGIGFRSVKNIEKMANSLQKAKTAEWDRWIASLNIPMIGHSLGKDISKALNLTSDNMKDLPKLLLTVPSLNLDKLGKSKTAAIVDWAKDKENAKLCKRLYDAGVRPEPLAAPKQVAGAKLNGIVVCLTGEMVGFGTRKEVEQKLQLLGAETIDDVKKNCNLLLVGEAPGSKLEKAKKKGVTIVHLDWLAKVLSA